MVSQLGLTWTRCPGIHDQDQILRGFEDPPPLLGLLPQRLLGPVRSVMSRAVLEMPMIAPEAALIGEMLSATSTEAAVLAQPHGFVLLDGFAPTDPAQMSSTSPSRSAGTISEMCRPTASAAA